MVWPVKKYVWKLEYALFQPGSWNSWCFISYYWKRFPVDGLLLRLWLTWYRYTSLFFWVLQGVLPEYSRNARRVLWKLARETHAPEDQFPQRNQYGDGRQVCDTCVVKLDPKWHYLDLRNSNLISIGNLTHSLTLGFIYGLNIHGCGMAEVVKIVWGKPKLMFN